MAASKQPVQPTSIQPPPWLAPTALLLIILGLADTTYLTIAHYTTPLTLACPETGVVNCAKVTTSIYSAIAGVPLALLGLIFFLINLPLHLPAAWRSANVWVRRGRLAVAASGVAVIVTLIYIELFKLNAICLYCTVTHVLAVLLFVATALGTALTAAPPPQKPFTNDAN